MGSASALVPSAEPFITKAEVGCAASTDGHPSDELARQRIKNLWRRRRDSDDQDDEGTAEVPARRI
jgi:hypothetical protein